MSENNTLEEGQRIENARVGYQMAIGLVNLVSQEIYSRFNAILVANSIIIAIIGFSFTSEHPFLLIKFLPFMGLSLCVLWFLFVKHGFHYQKFYREKAKELEKQYFADTFKLFTSDIPTSALIKWLPARRVSYIVIMVFAVIYIIMLLQIICNGV